MKKLFLLFLFLVFISSTAQAGEWVLWRCEFFSGAKVNPPIPLTEHKTLKECQNASKQEADYIFSWAKNEESVKTETVMRSSKPHGVIYIYKTGPNVTTDFRCYPYGVVPTQENFQSKDPV